MTTRSSNHSVSRMLPAARAVLIGLLLFATSAAGMPSIQAAEPGAAGSGARAYRIPGGSLSRALTRFAAAAGVLLSVDAVLTDGKQSPGLQGDFAVADGFAALLAGSGLEPVENADGSYTLRRVAQSDAVEAPRKGQEDLQTPSQEQPTVLPEMTVTAKPTDDTSYNAPNATTATKTDTPIFDTPVSIQVVPQQVMEDQQAILVKDALKNVSGVFWSGDFNYDGFQLRGFISDVFTTVYRNGLRLRRAKNEIANLEQIEVLKGPAAALYGRIEPGGLINLVTKKPLTEPYYSLEQQFGSFDLYRTALEATGPLNADRSLLYRFDLAYKNNDTFIDFVDEERVFVAPALTWRPTERTEINLNFEYQHDEGRYYSGIPIVGRRPAPIPISRYLGFGADEDQEFQTYDKILVGFDWSHRFTEDWILRQRFHYYFLDYVFNNVWFGLGVADDGRTFTRALDHEPADPTHTYATNIDLTGRFETFGMNHQVLVGADYFREGDEFEAFIDVAPPAFRPTIDIFNPVYGPIPQLSPSDLNNFSTDTQYWYGVYFQDQITLWDKLHILGGGRYDWATRRSGFSSVSLAEAEANESEVEDAAFSPRMGLVYQPWPWLSLYGNYVESLGAANRRRSMSGQPFEPETAQQYEVGFKTELLDRQLTSTMAFYHLTKQNVLTRDPLNPAFSIPVGEARSQGIEVDIAGQLTDSLSLIATYSLTDSEITKDTFGNQGNRFFNIPEHAGSFWAKYDFHEAPLTGLSLGAGIFLVGQRECDNENTCELPGYGRVDAFAAYKWTLGPTRLTAQLNVNNLLDKTYFESSGYGGQGFPGAPRSFFGLVRVEF